MASEIKKAIEYTSETISLLMEELLALSKSVHSLDAKFEAFMEHNWRPIEDVAERLGRVEARIESGEQGVSRRWVILGAIVSGAAGAVGTHMLTNL